MKIVKNIPNILSFCRIPLAFVFIFAFFDGESTTALAILLISVFTDIADGLIARAFDLVSDAGKLLDPSADKFMQCTVLSCLCVDGLLPLWLTVLCVAKEVIMVCASLALLGRSSEVVSSNFFGKAATAIFYCISVAVLTVPDPILTNGRVHTLVCILLVGSSIGAAIAYCIRYRTSLLNAIGGRYGSKETKSE